MGHGMNAFIENPDEYTKLVDDPSLMPTAIEEMLRWASPVMYFRRNVIRDTEIRGQEIKAGDKVTIWYVSANRDEDVFDDPFRFDIERSPNEHVAFGGGGPHHCLGANLARMQLRVFWEEMVRLVPEVEAAGRAEPFAVQLHRRYQAPARPLASGRPAGQRGVMTDTSNAGRLAGKVAVITGGARGQGEAEARLFVTEGAAVVITDVLEDEGQTVAKELGDAARFVTHNVADEADWQRVVDTAVAEFGLLNVVVNNAAIHWLRALEDESLEGFNRILSVNLLGTFLGIRTAIGPMRTAGGGSIVNISSIAGMTGLAWHGAYGSAKWAVRGLTKTAAVELGVDGIRVELGAPGTDRHGHDEPRRRQ